MLQYVNVRVWKHTHILGFTVPRVDEILSKYAEMSYNNYYKERYDMYLDDYGDSVDKAKEVATIYAEEKTYRDLEQGFQGWEYKFNTVSSSRGDYPFTTITIGVGTDKFSKMAAIACLRVRGNGQGKPGFKKTVLFPKLVFTYTRDLHGPGKELEDLFYEGVKCSSRSMYPDWLSLDGDTTIAEMWHTYGEVIAPMGCLSGDTIITIENNGEIKSISFEELWDDVSNGKIDTVNGIECQPNTVGDKYLYAMPTELKITDSFGNQSSMTNVLAIQRNYCTKWIKIKLKSDYGIIHELKCTLDHPFPVITDRGFERLQACELGIGDRIPFADEFAKQIKDGVILEPVVGTVVSYEFIEEEGYSYDVTTASDRFDANGVVVHNCRAFLSPWYIRGGMKPEDEDDRPVFTGRFNIGAVSLHLPMILAKARQENKDFYQVLDYYLELIRNLHKRTKAYLSEMRASINPLAFCEGGFYGGHLKLTDKIAPLLKSATASYGITALNELNRLYNEKSIYEDGEFPLEVMRYINNKLAEYKHEDNMLYAVYGTPAENLTGLQVKQFRAKYGIVEGVSDREYVSNSFHCHVSEDITPFEKQDKEYRYWNLFAGGRIQYVKYPINYNYTAIAELIRRAMEMGLYEGVNLSLAYCNNCGHEELNMTVCPKCGSEDLCKVERMNG